MTTTTVTKPTVLVLCTGNSCRSQMAEGLLRETAGDFLNAASAGSRPTGRIHPKAVEAMREIGIDISGQHSKHVNEFLDQNIALVITVCGNASDACPTFPGNVERVHLGFDDPSEIEGTEEEILAAFRATRDEMRRVIDGFSAGFRTGAKSGLARS